MSNSPYVQCVAVLRRGLSLANKTRAGHNIRHEIDDIHHEIDDFLDQWQVAEGRIYEDLQQRKLDSARLGAALSMVRKALDFHLTASGRAADGGALSRRCADLVAQLRELGDGWTPEARPAEVPPPNPTDLLWSQPDTIGRWARVYKISRNTMSKRLKEGQIHNRKYGSRYAVLISDLPATERHKHLPQQ